MKKQENKVILTSDDKKAVKMIEKSIVNSKEAFLQFVAGGVFILNTHDYERKVLSNIVREKFTADEWPAVQRQYNRRVACCLTLATRRSGWFEGLQSVEEVLERLKKEHVTLAMVNLIEASYSGKPEEKKKAGKPEVIKAGKPEEEEPEEEEPEEEEPEDEADIPLPRLIKVIEALTPAEIKSLQAYFIEKGYILDFRKATPEEQEKVANLYK